MPLIKWTSRILAAGMVLFSAPFYLGYGNPLPFANPDNTPLDNLWLAIMPVVYAGLIAGLRYPRLGGWLVVAAVAVGQVATLVFEGELVGPMLAPLIPAGLYVLTGHGPARKEPS